MAIQQVQNLPPQFIQDIGKDLATQITAQTAVPVVTTGIAGISLRHFAKTAASSMDIAAP